MRKAKAAKRLTVVVQIKFAKIPDDQIKLNQIAGKPKTIHDLRNPTATSQT
jgi:hypothetical protein